VRSLVRSRVEAFFVFAGFIWQLGSILFKLNNVNHVTTVVYCSRLARQVLILQTRVRISVLPVIFDAPLFFAIFVDLSFVYLTQLPKNYEERTRMQLPKRKKLCLPRIELGSPRPQRGVLTPILKALLSTAPTS
jgi:hypothetical protein